MAKLFWHTADWHVNRKTGLRIPKTILDEGDTSEISDTSRFLWRSLLDQQEIIKDKAKKYKIKKKDRWAGLGGDIGELDIKKRGEKIYTSNLKTVKSMIAETAQPITDICSKLFMVHGTYAHEGDIEELAADDLSCEIHPDTKQTIAHQWLIDLDGIRILFQHHGKLGRLPWTKANSLNQKTSRLLLQYGNKCPDIFIQSHNHQFATNDKSNWDKVLVIASPGMVLPNGFSARIDADTPDVGGLYFICENGQILEWDVMLYEPKGLTLWSQK